MNEESKKKWSTGAQNNANTAKVLGLEFISKRKTMPNIHISCQIISSIPQLVDWKLRYIVSDIIKINLLYYVYAVR